MLHEATSSSLTQNAIHQVLYNTDLLSEIFPWNTDTDVKNVHLHPLRVAQRCSQVCQLWRDFLIHAPNIWANIIDLTVLGRVDERWRDEVMVRTGSSPLAVRGTMGLTFFKRSEIQFFVLILFTLWDRIRIVDVTLASGWGINAIWPQDVKLFRTPAPLLESFKISKLPLALEQNSHLIFSNIAPRLREISCPVLHFNPDDLRSVSWVRNLRQLTVTAAFTTPQIVSILQRTPLLESLALKGSVKIETEGDGRRIQSTCDAISLPHLQSIVTECTDYPFHSAMFLLQMISPAPSCSAVIENVSVPLPDGEDDGLVDLYQVISWFSGNTLMGDDASKYRLSITNGGVRLVISISRTGEDSVSQLKLPTFRISFLERWRWNSYIESGIFNSFSPKSRTNIRTVTLHPLSAQHKTYQLFKLLAALPSVERLEASDSTLAFLHKASEEGKTAIFPNLSSVLLTHRTDNGRHRGFNGGFRSFLQNRQIKTLEIADWEDHPIDWTALDSFVGMEVVGILRSSSVCGSVRYICGSSDAHLV